MTLDEYDAGGKAFYEAVGRRLGLRYEVTPRERFGHAEDVGRGAALVLIVALRDMARPRGAGRSNVRVQWIRFSSRQTTGSLGL